MLQSKNLRAAGLNLHRSHFRENLATQEEGDGIFIPEFVKIPRRIAIAQFKTKNPPSRRATCSHKPP